MRFVIDARSAGAGPSGIGSYVRALAPRLAARSGRQNELRFWIGADAQPICEAPRITHHRIASATHSLNSLLWPARFDQLDDADVFHAPDNILGFNLRCRSIVTVHDMHWLEHPDYCQSNRMLRAFDARYFAAGIRHALKAANRIITGSAASADAILRFAPQAQMRVVVIPNAAESDFQPPVSRAQAAARAAQLVGSDAEYFLVLGPNALVDQHALALSGFAAAGLPQQRLLFAQCAPRAVKALEQLAKKLGVMEQVIFMPQLPEAGLIMLLQAAAALLHPSHFAGCALTLHKALASGCPVIASDSPMSREVLAGAGYLVPPSAADELGRALRRVLEERSFREELRARGLERARAFSWERTAELTFQVYRHVASKA
jgi:glycosyltransferase involved in cell wall biosynthesis